MSNRQKLIKDSNQLGNNLKIEFSNFMHSFEIPFMQNQNGIFFSLGDVKDNVIDKLISKLEFLKKFEINSTIHTDNSTEPMFNYDFKKEQPPIKDSEESEEPSSENENKVAFEYDKNVVKDMETYLNKINKKSIHVKYSIAKKKYNKQFLVAVNTKKIEDTDLSELMKEEYII